MATTKYFETDAWRLLEMLLTTENKLAVRVMLDTGLRVSDALSIRKSQITDDTVKFTADDTVKFTVEESKTKKEKICEISLSLRDELLKISSDYYVFKHRTDSSKHRTRQAVWADIKRARKAMRIDDVIACHSARKTYAVQAWRDTHDLIYVKNLLNHDRCETTLIYLISEFMK